MSDTVVDFLSLSQLLCTRLCHDLAGPIGAVAAGVELTAGDPTQVDAETLGLIGNSSAAASRKLKFLRAALGVPGAPTAMLGELGGLVEGYLIATAGRGGPAALSWPAPEALLAASRALGPDTVPLILNLCLLVLEAQPSCRRLTLEIVTTPGPRIVVVTESDSQRGVEWRPEFTDALGATPPAATAKTIQVHLLRALAARSRGVIRTEARPPVLQAAFVIP